MSRKKQVVSVDRIYLSYEELAAYAGSVCARCALWSKTPVCLSTESGNCISFVGTILTNGLQPGRKVVHGLIDWLMRSFAKHAEQEKPETSLCFAGRGRFRLQNRRR